MHLFEQNGEMETLVHWALGNMASESSGGWKSPLHNWFPTLMCPVVLFGVTVSSTLLCQSLWQNLQTVNQFSLVVVAACCYWKVLILASPWPDASVKWSLSGNNFPNCDGGCRRCQTPLGLDLNVLQFVALITTSPSSWRTRPHHRLKAEFHQKGKCLI